MNAFHKAKALGILHDSIDVKLKGPTPPPSIHPSVDVLTVVVSRSRSSSHIIPSYYNSPLSRHPPATSLSHSFRQQYIYMVTTLENVLCICTLGKSPMTNQ